LTPTNAVSPGSRTTLWKRWKKATGASRCWIRDPLGWFADRVQWEQLRTVAMVEAERHVGTVVSVERRCYLCSLPPAAKLLAQAVRSHWGIENQLHWVLDVQPNEDQCRVRAGHAAQNLATLRRLVLNLQRRRRPPPTQHQSQTTPGFMGPQSLLHPNASALGK